tara:strand:+ start:26652 stop:28052 length:1401 start_codon:yes stop_codon:yes gene_type:complete
MKIINLYTENLKRLTVVDITPDGNLVQITGKNGQGKTSVLDAIWWAIGGMKNIQTTPIRQGEERALIRLDLGDMKITRRFNAQDDGSYTTSLTVENGDGARFQSPQKMLDDLLGELTFDPLLFLRMKDAEKVKSLRSLVPGYDFDKAEASIKALFEERTGANRIAKQDKAAADQLSADLPDQLPAIHDVQSLLEQLEKAQAHNNAQDQLQRDIDAAKNAHVAAVNALELVEESLRQAQKRVNGCMTAIAALPTGPEAKINTDEIREEINLADASKDIINKAKERDQKAASAAAAAKESDDLTKSIDKIKAEAAAAIGSAELPIGNASIADGIVLLDGVPFEQASDAQQLQASIGIAMALNPRLKVVRVRDGSLLDDEAMAVLSKMADENDYQIWIERVDSTGTIGFVLEEGHVKGQNIVLEKKAPREEPERLKAENAAKWEMAKENLGDEAPKAPPAGSLFDADQE